MDSDGAGTTAHLAQTQDNGTSMTRRLALAFIAALALSACSSPNRLPPLSSVRPGVAKEGTLANEQLVRDATAALYKIVGGTEPMVRLSPATAPSRPGATRGRQTFSAAFPMTTSCRATRRSRVRIRSMF